MFVWMCDDVCLMLTCPDLAPSDDKSRRGAWIRARCEAVTSPHTPNGKCAQKMLDFCDFLHRNV